MAPNLQKICRSIVAAKLIGPADLEKFYRHWRAAEPNSRDDVKAFARALVQNGHATAEQVAKFLKEAGNASETPVAEPIDVELVVVPDPSRQFDRRHWLFAAGGAAVATATIVPIMWLTRPTKSNK